MIDSAKGFMGDILSSFVREVKMAAIPMSVGGRSQKASAQTFANNGRASRSQWQRIDRDIVMRFGKDRRTAIYDAMDEQSVLMQQGLDTKGRGIDVLNPAEKQLALTLNKYGQEHWAALREADMVTGDGIPFWTPRMAAMIGEDGNFMRPGGDGK
jgi:hypothetical protein